MESDNYYNKNLVKDGNHSIQITVSPNTYDFLKALECNNDDFLVKIAEDVVASIKDELLEAIDKRLIEISKTKSSDLNLYEELYKDEEKRLKIMKEYIKKSRRYSMEELLND